MYIIKRSGTIMEPGGTLQDFAENFISTPCICKKSFQSFLKKEMNQSKQTTRTPYISCILVQTE